MKQIRLVLSIFTLCLLTSCVVTEKISFNEDHSGKLVYDMDMSQIMAMAGDKLGETDTKKSKKKKNKKEETEMDSTFTFKDIFKDKQDSLNSLPEEERLRYKQMENYTVRMVMSEKNKKFNYIFSTAFKSPSELQNLVSPLNAASQMNPMGSQLGSDTKKNEGITKYTYDGKSFSKFVSISPREAFNKELKKALDENPSETEEEDLSNSEIAEGMDQAMKMISEQSKYFMEVSFPKKIKSISIPNAKISEDGKSAILTFSLEDYMESKNLNFEVELE